MIDFEDQPSVIEYKTLSSKKFYYKKKSGLSAGSIVTIILIPILILGLVIGLIYFIRNKNIKESHVYESSNKEIINISNKS